MPTLTRHAEKRIEQRGLRPEDVGLILEFGTETSEGYLLRRKDVAEIERRVKGLVSRLHRLAGTYVVADGETVITAFPATRKQQRRLLRP